MEKIQNQNKVKEKQIFDQLLKRIIYIRVIFHL